MKAALTLLLCSLVLVRPATAQSPRAAAAGAVVKASIGYTYLSLDMAPAKRVNLQGLELNLTADFLPRIGVSTELSYTRASDVFGTGHHSDVLSYLIGPVYYPLRRRKFQIYVDGLIGGARVTGPVPSSAGKIVLGYANQLSWEIGAGAELPISGPIYVRAGADYLHTKYFNSLRGMRGQKDLKTTVSVVYVFGSHRKR
jgi:opacity protein-like surface antigen